MPDESTMSPTAPPARSAYAPTRRALRMTPPRIGGIGGRTASQFDTVAERRGEIVGSHVELCIAEPVDPQDLGDHLGVVELRQRDDTGQQQVGVDFVAQLEQVDAVAQVRCGGGEDVTTGERRSGTRQLMGDAGQFDRSFRPARDGDRRSEEAVVRPDEHSLAAGHLDGDRAASRRHPRVDDSQHDPGRDVADAARQRERSRRARRMARSRGSGR